MPTELLTERTIESQSGTAFSYTICPVLAASNLAVLLGWFHEEFDRIGADPVYLRSLPNNAGWLPHFNHAYPHLFRDGGSIPPIHAKAGGADTRLIGISWIRGQARGHVLVDTGSALSHRSGTSLAVPSASTAASIPRRWIFVGLPNIGN